MTSQTPPDQDPNDVEDQEYAARLASLLREAEGDLPDDVADRLYQARAQAVDAARQPVKATRRWLVPSMGVGMTAAAAVLVVVLMLPATTRIEPLPAGEDMELAAAQDLELLEDLEFVAWMVAMEDSEALSNSG